MVLWDLCLKVGENVVDDGDWMIVWVGDVDWCRMIVEGEGGMRCEMIWGKVKGSRVGVMWDSV